jgi:uncharacterized membrane protein
MMIENTAPTSTGLAGWLLLVGGAYLGGHLVYQHKVGTDHARS